MADVKIQALKNGPLLVKGETDILDSNGEVVQSGAQAALCRCGHSRNKPFCDGSHVKADFRDLGAALSPRPQGVLIPQVAEPR